MKKSLLALAVVAVAASANAATVYDKDGTSLTIDGRVQSVFYSGNHNKAGENDSSINNSSRFGIGGKTQITDWVAGLGYAQWDTSDGDNRDNFSARDQYVGADFGEFGLLKAGRFLDSSYYAENVTDHYEDAAGTMQGEFNGTRRGGQLMYTYNNYGFYGQLGVQTAQDNARVWDGYDERNVDSGFNLALGYTFDDVLFGPLSFRTGYSYLKGQKDGDLGHGDNYNPANGFDKFKHANVGIAWGNLDSGFYVAGLYDYAKLEELDGSEANHFVNDETEFAVTNLKKKGFELAAGYAFDNRVSFLIGYESAKYTFRGVNGADESDEKTVKVKRIPVFVNYKINSNFNVWGEVGFNAGSDHNEEHNNKIDKKADHTVFSVGARYTF